MKKPFSPSQDFSLVLVTVREDGRLTNRFCYGKLFCTLGGGGGGGGGVHKTVSQILAIIDFFKQRNYWKNPVRKEEYYR